MPYSVSGLVEATWEPPATHGPNSLWFPVLCLDGFGLGGDEVSDYLFGLAKHPSIPACFRDRGVPIDGTRIMQLLVAENESFIKAHGEGNFGYTHALLHEIEASLAKPGAPSLTDSPWSALLETIIHLHDVQKSIPRDQWRLIVWANW